MVGTAAEYRIDPTRGIQRKVKQRDRQRAAAKQKQKHEQGRERRRDFKGGMHACMHA